MKRIIPFLFFFVWGISIFSPVNAQIILNYNEVALPNLEMIAVQGGTFYMGSDNGEKNEKPTFKAALTDFYISKTEITVAQYRTFCKAERKEMPNLPEGTQNDHPISNISWEDAMAFCAWLSKTSGKIYTLPTEAQWEFAARGGLKSNLYKYSGSDNIAEIAWFDGNSEYKIHAIAQKEANELGIYDMSGNVWEWCLDYFDANFYATVKNDANPPLNIECKNNTKMKAIRGGAAANEALGCRVAYRMGFNPTAKNPYTGFRVCRLM